MKNSVLAQSESPLASLSQAEAKQRLASQGPNEIPEAKSKNTVLIIKEIISEPMILILCVCVVLYAFLGEISDALFLAGSIFLIVFITLYQKHKTEKALAALKNLSSPKAKVIRDGEAMRIDSRELVRGDLIILSEGDRVPADARILQTQHLTVDESLLTGESVAVRKSSEDTPLVFSATLVVGGMSYAEVIATGKDTELGKIGTSLHRTGRTQTRLQTEMNKLVRRIAVLVGLFCFVLFVAFGYLRQDWLGALLNSLSMVMSLLPEEFPVVLTVFLALGAWRISKIKVLTRYIPAIETLGEITVLCADKTGTLTQNQMTVSHLFNGQASWEAQSNQTVMPEEFHKVTEFAILASQKVPFDPMEKAIHGIGNQYLTQTDHLHADWTLIREYPLSSALFSMSQVWQTPTAEKVVIATKGSPEAIFDLCHLPADRLSVLQKQLLQLTDSGLRVLGVARAYLEKSAKLPDKQHDFDFEFLGFVGLIDPVRDGVTASIKECQEAGIRVMMITGDYPGTAKAIAGKIGLNSESGILTGTELQTLSREQLQLSIKNTSLFARIIPQQKLDLVKALKANGEIVAMTGDGVNDAPALKEANVGVAMGGRGTDVARETAELIILDDDFSSIVRAIKVGRTIYENMKKALAYLISIHIPIAGMAALPIFFGWPTLLYPMHIVFLELIIDPVSSIVFENEPAEKNIMKRPPRSQTASLISKAAALFNTLQGFIVLVAVLGITVYARRQGLQTETVRTLAFVTLILSNFGLIFSNQTWLKRTAEQGRQHNKSIWIIGTLALIILGSTVFIPTLTKLFHFNQLNSHEVILASVTSLVCIGLLMGTKILKQVSENKVQTPQ